MVLTFGLKLRDQFPQLPPGLGVEAGSRLVEKQELGVSDQSTGDGEALLLSARKSTDAGVALFAELDLVDHFADIARVAVEALEERQGLIDGQLLGQLGVLELDAEQLAKVVGIRFPGAAEDFDVARVGVSRPSQISIVVVLPAPFGPRRPKHSPVRTSRSRPSTATTSS